MIGRRLLYPDITPVNTFRLIFKSCFGEDCETLPDREYFSWYGKPYELVDVTEQIARNH